MIKNIEETIKELKRNNISPYRKSQSFSFGTKDECKNMFITLFKELDKTVDEVKYFPQYDQIIDWMTNTQGKGLLLMGSTGLGKTTIASFIIPFIFLNKFNKIITPIPADQIPEKLNILKYNWAPSIDDLGTEILCNNYGEKSEGFNFIINEAERKVKPVFVTTNLSYQGICERYGDRTLDRFDRLCVIVELEGESLR